MTPSIRWILAALLLAALLAALLWSVSTPAAQALTPPAKATTAPADITSIDVRVDPGYPADVFVRAQGALPNGCVTLGGINQQRQGNLITVTVNAINSGANACDAVFGFIDETIKLDGTFLAGKYDVQVNGLAKEFTVTAP